MYNHILYFLRNYTELILIICIYSTHYMKAIFITPSINYEAEYEICIVF